MEEASGPGAVTPAPQSSELLGHPPDARLLIVNCDDFGMYPAINAAVIESIEEGIASSCSLMVPCPAAPQAMKLLGRRPRIPFGIHLTLVCEMPDYRWGPIAARERVPSVLDPEGELFPPTLAGRAALLGQARLDEIEFEFRAQINAVADAGLTPTHLDFHCLADGGREDILDLTVGLAAEYGLAVRVWLEPARQRMRHRGLPVTDNDFLDSFSLAIEGKAARYVQMLRDLPAGLNEWAVHPSVGNQDSQAVDDGWRVRRTDYEFLISPQAREILQQEDIFVIDYRTIQRVWGMTLTPEKPATTFIRPAPGP
ncbi:polysaccharide deacetylase family protein [Streptomyces violaceusniger]|uniref:YdjC family protein n=1 Tax=Streptomyces violaceusniger (strain Tu 4113) TaxID=653045 RepID=G2P7F2_STRV4|nr:polysaccharide deacetylase family protein [Streptomyces violaceusniger]AEM87189.1 YdjC family protein [Streptomyces violaceusniger Tu 4113]